MVVTDPVDVDTEEYVHKLMMCHTIKTAMNTPSKCVLRQADLHQYLKLAAAIEVELRFVTLNLHK